MSVEASMEVEIVESEHRHRRNFYETVFEAFTSTLACESF